MSNFNAYGKYYDLLYKDKDYQMEVAYLDSLIRKHRPSASKILELGCGSGSHAEWLTKKGYQVTGIERSAEMVSAALQKKIQGFTPMLADITEFSVEDRFDVAVSLFHVISYLTSTESLIKTFELTARHLKPGGIFVFDVWYAPAVLNLRPTTRIKRLENEEIRITRIAESVMDINRNLVDVNFEVMIESKAGHKTETIRELHPMRYFGLPEIELLAKLTSFRLIGSEEFLTGHQPGENTWGVCFILERND